MSIFLDISDGLNINYSISDTVIYSGHVPACANAAEPPFRHVDSI